MTLPLVIAPGDPGHIDHHEELHELLSRLDGQNDFLATGVLQDTLANMPVASASNLGLFRFATDVPAVAYSDGSSWRSLLGTTTSNQFTAINEFDDDVFFGSGRPWVDPMNHLYGAAGDGVTNDDAAVQAAMNAAAGQVLRIDATYAVDRIEAVDNVVVQGTGSLVKAGGSAGTNNGVLHIENVTRVWVEGITIDAANYVTPYSGGTVTQRACITMANACSVVRVRDVTITNGGRDGIYMYSTGGGSPTDVLIDHCNITNSTRWAIAVVAGVNVRVHDCDCDAGGLGGFDAEPNATASIDNVIVSDSRWYDSGNSTGAGQLQASLGAGAGNPGPFRRVHFVRNYCEGHADGTSAIIRFSSFPEGSAVGNVVVGATENAISTTGASNGTVIANNQILDSGTQTSSPSVNTASIFVSSPDTVVTGNVIRGSYWNGILVSSTNYAVIVGNIVRDVGQAFTALAFNGDGIHIFNSNHCLVTGNLVVDDQATPTMSSGIRTRQSGAPTCIGNFFGPNRVIGARGNNWSITNGTTAGSGRTATIPGAVAAGATVTVSVSVLGARSGNAAFASVEAIPAGLVVSAPYVSANDTVTLHITNVTAAPINPGTITTYVQMMRA